MTDPLPLKWDERLVGRIAVWMTRNVSLTMFLLAALLICMVALFFGGSCHGRLSEPVL